MRLVDIDHVTFRRSLFDYLGGYGTGLSLFCCASNAEEAKKLCERSNEPVWLGESKHGNTYVFLKSSPK